MWSEKLCPFKQMCLGLSRQIAAREIHNVPRRRAMPSFKVLRRGLMKHGGRKCAHVCAAISVACRAKTEQLDIRVTHREAEGVRRVIRRR